MNIEIVELGNDFVSYVCTNDVGFIVKILNLGGIIQSIVLPTGEDVVLGYETPEEYLQHHYYMGATIGRYANRIGNARFTLNGMTYLLDENDGKHCLHGGDQGLHTKLFQHRIVGDTLVLYRKLPKGEDGFPGNLQVEIHYQLADDNTLNLEYFVKTDEDTIVNLTNHSYFNLDGVNAVGDCLSHILHLESEMVTVNDKENIPTGEKQNVEGTPLDFNKPKEIGADIEDESLENPRGYDHNFIINGDESMKQFATVEGKLCNMVVSTDCPCVQFYTGNFIESHPGKYGVTYGKRAGFCLETGMYPNSINVLSFADAILKAGKLWNYKTQFQFLLK